MLIYIRCAYANKATLSGFISIFFALAYLTIAETHSDIAALLLISLAACIGFLLLGLTRFGRETPEAYQTVLAHLERAPHDTEIVRAMSGRARYCTRLGFELALQDFCKEK